MENQAPLSFWQRLVQRVRSWFGISSEPEVAETIAEETEEAVLATRVVGTRGGGDKSKKGKGDKKSSEKPKGRLSEHEEDEMFDEGSYDPKKKAQG